MTDAAMEQFRKGRRRKTRALAGHPRPIFVDDEQAKLLPAAIPEIPEAMPGIAEPKPTPEPSFKQIAQDEATYRKAQKGKLQTPTPKGRK